MTNEYSKLKADFDRMKAAENRKIIDRSPEIADLRAKLDEAERERNEARAEAREYKNRMEVAVAVLSGTPVYDIWQVAPVGSDTEIGQLYWAVKKPKVETSA